MALPWQADFLACSGNHWWPATRPDHYLPHSQYGILFTTIVMRLIPGDHSTDITKFKEWTKGFGYMTMAQHWAKYVN